LHLSKDSSIHAYNYKNYNYNSSGFTPSFFYNNDDRFFIGLGYGFTNHKWRKTPFATKQSINIHYSLSQNAFSINYSAQFPDIIKKWNATLISNFDEVKWTNFFGLGNESRLSIDDNDYYRLRTREWLAGIELSRHLGRSTISSSFFFRSVKILNDTGRYVIKVFAPLNKDVLENNNYAGFHIGYSYSNIDDSIVPQKGVLFSTSADYMINTSQNEFFQKYSGKLQFFIPLINKFSLAIKSGTATVVGTNNILNSAEFYEHAVFGTPDILRGYKRERFWGKTSFYNDNELRYITNIRSHILNAKAGVLLFLDDGRVWMPGENSNIIHSGYGAGILLAPFNVISATLTYGISNESRLFQLTINKYF
jgi:outer membrane protein assembly factor BamA